VDDRILFIPAPFAPDPAVLTEWPALRALFQRLNAFLPLDVALLPTLLSQPHTGDDPFASVADAVRRQLRPEHHVLTIGSPLGPVLQVLGEQPARSHVAVGFVPTAALMQASSDRLLASAFDAIRATSRNVSQLVQLAMQGAQADEIERVIGDVKQTLDLDYYHALVAAEWSSELRIAPSSIPTLYLSYQVALPGGEELLAIFRRYAPAAVDGGALREWGRRIHEEAGGHELADKAIPFIQEVIAQRQSG
jgi:hypothetical protein